MFRRKWQLYFACYICLLVWLAEEKEGAEQAHRCELKLDDEFVVLDERVDVLDHVGVIESLQ